ncbi:choloylglycine hydrolase [Limosilactobacillus ingluviei]|uniref:choloylglycine hydrolase n=3 Tax=Lactobacillaceae TaxID=33958 RepID=A0A0R1U3N2_9LACO|nr:choloylglycine hydrolase [Limosilactobacillus ingluviei]KRL87916.1 choloylglycine hydrolase [Limosilactobacillus ingluviei DSM 15946]
MCTAVNFQTGSHHFFGRNLDLEISYGEQVVVTPRNYPFHFRQVAPLTHHYALIGMGIVVDDYPLYFDATNEKGLSMAGLNYPDNADYKALATDKANVTPFEFIPWVLGQAASIAEAKQLLTKLNLVKINFSDDLPLSPLHWLIGDTHSATSLVVECDKDGLHVYDNPVGVLTNNPSFDKQLFNLNNYRSVSPRVQENSFQPATALNDYSRGLGSHFLPGGMDSMSRFVKVAFTKLNAPHSATPLEQVTDFFHILHSVEQPKNLDEVAPNQFEYTIYSSCVDADQGIYYYTTYTNNQINAVKLHNVDLDQAKLTTYALADQQTVNYQN